MTTEALDSASITAMDASPKVLPDPGDGGVGVLMGCGDTVTGTTGMAAGSTYRLCRFPSNAVLKTVKVWLDAGVSALAADIDIAWSDSNTDGTPVTYVGTIPQLASADNKFYGAAVDLHAITTPTDYIAHAGGAARNLPVWENMGYTSNPGGYFDLMLKLTGTTTGAPIMNGEVTFVLDT